MPSQFDETDFIDRDFQAGQQATATHAVSLPAQAGGQRPPSREELDSRVSEAHNRLAELKRAQEVLERERAALEEARRRRAELQTGREEMLEHLTRGVALLEESEFTARRDAEQMARTIEEFRAALSKIQAIQEAGWTEENYNIELTRALTAIENARMEWNSARLKWPVLSGGPAGGAGAGASPGPGIQGLLANHSLAELCKLGLALTWPLALVGLLSILLFLYLILNR